jgi:hypothetical protein
MSGAAFLRLKKLKGSGIVLKAARHNRRVIQAELGASGSIDASRSELNETLSGPPSSDAVASLAKSLMLDAGVTKLRKDAVLAVEVVFSLPASHSLDDRSYFLDCAAWAGSQFGGTKNILSVDIHRDEAQPHCHVLILPLRDERLVGSEMVGNRQKLLATQKSFHEVVASKYGLQKAPAKLIGPGKAAAASAVLKHLRESSDPALRSKVWPNLREAIEGNPAPFLGALGITLKAAAKPLRTMAQIFTSKGKGSGKESTSIGFDAIRKARTLSCVGFSEKQSPSQAKEPPTDAPVMELVRIRDRDLDPSHFDQSSGEYFDPSRAERRNRSTADNWLSDDLIKRTG